MSRNSTLAAFGASALFLTSAVALGNTPAVAAVGDTVCDYWHAGDSYNVTAVQTGERDYTVSIADTKLVAFENPDADAYIRLPLEPDLRMSTNEVSIDPRFAVSEIAASQGIVSGPSEPGASPDWAIESYVGLAPAPWESAMSSTGGITWRQDMDAYSDASGSQAKPSEFWLPFLAEDASTGVLEFTVTIPDDVGGEVPIFKSMSVSFTGAQWNTDTGDIEALEDLTDTVPGCSITVEAIEGSGDGAPDPASPDPTHPDVPPTDPKLPVRVDTGR